MGVIDLKIELTSEACPEQYNVYYKGICVAYIRLRHGCLQLDVPGCQGMTIYEHNFHDNYKGRFKNELERAHYFGIIMEKIITFYEKTRKCELLKVLMAIEMS